MRKKFMMRRKFLVGVAGMLFFATNTKAQQYNQEAIDSLIKATAQSQVARASKFLITGYTQLTGEFNKKEASFTNIGLTPIFLWQPHKNILIEAELELEQEGSETALELGYIDAAFFLNKYVTARVGKFISPFGIFQDRLHPWWINKLPTYPIANGEADFAFAPTSETGVDLRGGIQLGSSKMNYSVFAGNGAQLITNPDDPEKQGSVVYGLGEGINKKITLGGRVGFLPFSNSSLEIGASYRSGKVGERSTDYQNVGSKMYAFDLAYGKQLAFLKGFLDVKAQYNNVKVDNANYVDPDDPSGLTLYSFENKRNSYFAQGAYRPTMSQSKFLKKTELVYRYAAFNPPSGAKDLEEIRQSTYGINYWFTWRTAFKLAYQSQRDANTFFAQIAVGF